jgi:hypothetical protein
MLGREKGYCARCDYCRKLVVYAIGVMYVEQGSIMMRMTAVKRRNGVLWIIMSQGLMVREGGFGAND